jgi:hypothetical protein
MLGWYLPHASGPLQGAEHRPSSARAHGVSRLTSVSRVVHVRSDVAIATTSAASIAARLDIGPM